MKETMIEHWQNVKCIQDDAAHVSKFVFTSEGKNGAVAETVLYRYPTYQERTVVCFSVMAGCPVGCRFCGTGEFFIRNLTVDEIVEQVVHALESTGVDPKTIQKLQLMSMSMGEPLLNKNGLTGAFRRLHELYPQAALLISTSAPDIDYSWVRALSVEIPQVGLQFSIHESSNEARDNLIPFKAKLNLKQIADQGELWLFATGRQPFFNYCAHENNSSDRDAERLNVLFNPSFWQATISVICESDESVAAANVRQRELANRFMEKLMNLGYSTRCFDPAGQDTLGGGCGQLWHTQNFARNHPELTNKSCGAGKEKVHAPRVIDIIPV